MLLVLIAAVLFSGYAGVTSFVREDVRGGVFWTLTLMVGFMMLLGLFTVNPNEGRVLQLFGAYRGTVKTPGLRWTNPFYSKHHVSLRIHNFESGKLKVNDRDGNPIEIASVVVWKVVDTAEASFEVENYEHYVTVQSEAAVRNLATHYPYDAHEADDVSLRGSTDLIAKALKQEIQERLDKAGVRVIEARISHLASRAGDRLGDAAPAAGRRHHRRAAEDRGGRGRHGRHGPRSAQPQRLRSFSTRSARLPW